MIYWNCNWAFETFFFALLIAVSNRRKKLAQNDRQGDETRRKLWLRIVKNRLILQGANRFMWIAFSSMKNRSPESDFRHKTSFIYLFMGFILLSKSIKRENLWQHVKKEKLIKCILRAWQSWKVSWIAVKHENCTCSTKNLKLNAIEMSHE